MLHLLIGLATALIALQTDFAAAVCGERPVIWRNDNITCPEHAVCADVFNTSRNWLNGTRCPEKNIFSNCICPGNTVCPYNNPNYRLYASLVHQQFICEPACQLPWCASAEVQRDPLSGMGRSGSRTQESSSVVAKTFEQGAEEFGGMNYYKINCRCPRHHFPAPFRRRGRSTSAVGYRWNEVLERWSPQYICNNGPRDPPREDPCPPSPPN